jgi:hypothetical protein
MRDPPPASTLRQLHMPFTHLNVTSTAITNCGGVHPDRDHAMAAPRAAQHDSCRGSAGTALRVTHAHKKGTTWFAALTDAVNETPRDERPRLRPVRRSDVASAPAALAAARHSPSRGHGPSAIGRTRTGRPPRSVGSCAPRTPPGKYRPFHVHALAATRRHKAHASSRAPTRPQGGLCRSPARGGGRPATPCGTPRASMLMFDGVPLEVVSGILDHAPIEHHRRHLRTKSRSDVSASPRPAWSLCRSRAPARYECRGAPLLLPVTDVYPGVRRMSSARPTES